MHFLRPRIYWFYEGATEVFYPIGTWPQTVMLAEMCSCNEHGRKDDSFGCMWTSNQKTWKSPGQFRDAVVTSKLEFLLLIQYLKYRRLYILVNVYIFLCKLSANYNGILLSCADAFREKETEDKVYSNSFHAAGKCGEEFPSSVSVSQCSSHIDTPRLRVNERSQATAWARETLTWAPWVSARLYGQN